MNTQTQPITVPHIVPTHAKPGTKLNWLRAAVLGANDGIVSTASLIVGVAGASNSRGFILTAGVAGLVAGALSMGVGEYVSVSTQRDTEKAMLEKEREELLKNPDYELQELASMYKQKGLSDQTALTVARELTSHDAFASHVETELGIDPNNLTNPWHAAFASSGAFVFGAIIPIVMILISSADWRLPVTFAGVLMALVVTGAASAHAGEAGKVKATVRVVIGGMLAMAVTFGIGKLFGTTGI
ncbi:MAG: VIT family protein [Candidatus Doudnabacteria bacterium]|nr:VIT family protein [Candidatus Doudnabacteria bacterium]